MQLYLGRDAYPCRPGENYQFSVLCNKREFLKRTDPSAGIFTNRPGKSKLIGQMLNPELFVAVSESNVYSKQSRRREKVSLVAGNAGSTFDFSSWNLAMR